MKCLLNLNGNFSLFFLFLIIFSCNKEQKSEDIGREIINKNIIYFISNLYHSPYKNANKQKYPIFVLSKVGKSNFFIENCESIDEIEGLNVIENCKQDYFDLINDNGFKIDEHTKYISFEIKELSDEILAKKNKT
ncbi:hypothetical protein H5J24_20675 [Chryseobacterium capnotolerans]|uniref:hypothetical protein n=1 Tax=Chryseobacterium TaxID=59732 RepID=UPI00083AC84C|nr:MULTISPECIES: hypothetical protein [Chryseobacterium]UHO37975.1 hypothetical protein H5J24_20675 [Chryseobacterium capnotolerans]